MQWVLVDIVELVPTATAAPLVIGATLEMMVSRGAGRREAFFDWSERCGLLLEACIPLEVGARARGLCVTRDGTPLVCIIAVVNGVSCGMGGG